METKVRNPVEFSDHGSVLPDELLVHFVFAKPGEGCIIEEATISLTSLQQAVSKIFRQIRTRFSPEEQSFLENTIVAHYGMIRANELYEFYVYVVITETIKEEGGEEIVTNCLPLAFVKNPIQYFENDYCDFSEQAIVNIQAIGRKFKSTIRRVNEIVRTYGESLSVVEVIEGDLDLEGCSICLQEFEVWSQVIRLPCRHIFCSLCILSWFFRKGSCPLCRYPLIPA